MLNALIFDLLCFQRGILLRAKAHPYINPHYSDEHHRRASNAQPIKLRADIEPMCYTSAGIDAIKKALRAGEKQSSEAAPIKAKLVAPPLYVLSTNATDKVSIAVFFSPPMLDLFHGCWLCVVRCCRPSRTCYRSDSKYGPKHEHGDVDRECEPLRICPMAGAYVICTKSIVSLARAWKIYGVRYRPCAKTSTDIDICRRSRRKASQSIVI